MSISAQTSDGRDYEVSIIKHSRVQGITIALAGKTGDAQSPIPVWQQTELDTGRNTGQGFIDYGLARYSEDGQLTMVEFGADVPIIDKISDVNCDDEPGASDAEEYESWLAAKLDQIQKSAGVILASVNIEQVRPGVHRLNFYSSNHAFSIKPVVDDIPDNFLIIDGGPVVFVAVEAVGIQETYEVKISDGILHILVTRNDATQKYIKLPLNIKKPAIRSLNELNLQERMQLSDMTCLGYNWEEIFQFEFNPKF